jgi:1,4-alpha-glucan branching enzyme
MRQPDETMIVRDSCPREPGIGRSIHPKPERNSMLQKSYYNEGRNCRVTFRMMPSGEVDSVHLVSDADDWDKTVRPMTRRKDGSFSVTLTLKPGRRYGYRYLVDGERWVTDPDADDIVANEFGETDGVVSV